MQTFTLLAILLNVATTTVASPLSQMPVELNVRSPIIDVPAVIYPRGATPVPKNYSKTVLYHHNCHRLNHSSVPATYNTKIAGYASIVAQSCIFAHNRTVGGGGYGQNIAAYGASGNIAELSPSAIVAKAITGQWYNSEFNSFLPSYYGEATPDLSNFEAWGHFSQIVWNRSTSVGCASQYCPAKTIFSDFASWYTVCNYLPPGNVAGYYGKNIGKPRGEPTIYPPPL